MRNVFLPISRQWSHSSTVFSSSKSKWKRATLAFVFPTAWTKAKSRIPAAATLTQWKSSSIPKSNGLKLSNSCWRTWSGDWPGFLVNSRTKQCSQYSYAQFDLVKFESHPKKQCRINLMSASNSCVAKKKELSFPWYAMYVSSLIDIDSIFRVFVNDGIENSVEDYSSSRMVSSVGCRVSNFNNFKHGIISKRF